jgi:two-component sensor histidine kinase
MDSLKRPINVLNPISILCKLYIQQNQVAKAEPLAIRLQKDGMQYHAKAFISEGYKALSDIAHIRKQDALALEYYRQFNAWDDSVFNDTKQRSLANVQSRAELAQKELEVQYKTNEKTQENKILKLQNGNLRNTLIGAGVLALMLILLAFLVMRMNRIKEVDNKLLKQQKQQIELQSQEKDTLMLEIHHRVKNNLQIVSSLLNLQANSMADENAITALRESQNRVKSIALIHQKLYAQEALSAILLEEYINQLSADLKSVFNAQMVTIRCAVYPPHLRLNMDTSIPLGVILNELITNSIKYAQVNKQGGVISIDIKDNLDGTCTLQFSDNGIGMPAGFDFKTAATLGMRIVNELTRQIRGTLTYSADVGSKFTLIFPLDAQKK